MDLADVKKVALLARLPLSDEELQASGEQLNAILDYVRVLDEVDIAGVAPMPHPVPAENVFREDQMLPSLPRESRTVECSKIRRAILFGTQDSGGKGSVVSKCGNLFVNAAELWTRFSLLKLWPISLRAGA